MDPGITASVLATSAIAIGVVVAGRVRRWRDRNAPPPPEATAGLALPDLVVLVHREFVNRTRSRSRDLPPPDRPTVRRVVEHLIDVVCPHLNAVEQEFVIAEVLGRIPWTAPPGQTPPEPTEAELARLVQRRSE